MRKTTVYLTDEEAEGLRHLAAATGRSQAELIREGVRRVLARRLRRTFHSLAIGESDGTRPRWDAEDLYQKTRGER
jgi:Arc/MetJ-type ribon-helix-helix transcriptional regulator